MSEYQGTRHDVRYLGIQTGLVAVYADGNRLSRLPSAYTRGAGTQMPGPWTTGWNDTLKLG